MTRMRVIAGAILLSGTVVFAVPGALLAASRADRGGSGRLTLTGRVGPLEFDLSTEASVEAFAGQPGATGRGNFGDGDPGYLSMGYACQEHGRPWLWRVDHFDFCRTVFFINAHTHRLVAFRSVSQSYSFLGARTGMTTRAVNRLTGGEAGTGCFTGYVFGSRHDHASVWGIVKGGLDKRERRGGRRIVGGHLKVLESESHRYPVGLLSC